MNLHLDDLALFVRVAELGTLSAAARERDAPVSQVTRCLARLEAACGARLMHRSTHGLSLTDEGDTFLAYARRLLDTREPELFERDPVAIVAASTFLIVHALYKASLFLIGTEMDYQSTVLKSGFVFNNPNVVKSCGCGSSFQV